MSMVVDFGRTSRPGLPCLRAAVGPYRLVSVTFLLSFCHSGVPRSGEPGIHNHSSLYNATSMESWLWIPALASLGRNDKPLKYSQILCDDLIVSPRLGRGAGKHHGAGIHDHHVVGKVERELDVLLDQHDRQSFGLQLRDGAADFVDDLRGETL